jgi:hypothetical protein
MIKPSGGIRPITWGKHCIDSQAARYAFNYAKLLQLIFPHINLELQLKVVMKQ